MNEITPDNTAGDVEVDGQAALISTPGDHYSRRSFWIWDGQAIIGDVRCFPRSYDSAWVYYQRDTQIEVNGNLDKCISVFSQIALRQTGVERLLVELPIDDQPSIRAFESTGFRLAVLDHSKKTNTYELYEDAADPDKKGLISYRPVRVYSDQQPPQPNE